MPSQTNEIALECIIEKKLTGTTTEDLKVNGLDLREDNIYRSGNGFYIGNAKDFDARIALDTTRFWDFLQSTQKDELAKLQKQTDWKLKYWSGWIG